MELLKNKPYLLFFLLLWGCQSKYPGFTEKNDNIYIKLHQFGDQKNLVLCDAYESILSIKLRLHRQNKNSFDYWNDYSYQQISAEDLGNKNLGELLCHTKQGDSLSLIFPYNYIKASLIDDYYTDSIVVPDTTMMQMELKVVKLSTKQAVQKELATRFAAGKIDENAYLKTYLYNEGVLGNCLAKHGVFILKTKETSGDTVKYGLDLGINYQGYFLDGTQFDNTYLDSTTLYFQLGKPDQVIQGLSIALGYLKEGEEARVYIPSYLGFGQRGSTDGRVPPNTPIYFDLIVSDVFTPQEIEAMKEEELSSVEKLN